MFRLSPGYFNTRNLMVAAVLLTKAQSVLAEPPMDSGSLAMAHALFGAAIGIVVCCVSGIGIACCVGTRCSQGSEEEKTKLVV